MGSESIACMFARRNAHSAAILLARLAAFPVDAAGALHDYPPNTEKTGLGTQAVPVLRRLGARV